MTAREMKVSRFLDRTMDPHRTADALLLNKEDWLFWELFCEGCPALDGGDGCAREVETPMFSGCEREGAWRAILGAIETMAESVGLVLDGLAGPSTDGEAAT